MGIQAIELIHYAYEAQNTEISNKMIEKGDFEFNYSFFTPSDFNALSYVIGQTTCHLSKLIFIDCKREASDVHFFNLNSDACQHLKYLQYKNECVGSQDLEA